MPRNPSAVRQYNCKAQEDAERKMSGLRADDDVIAVLGSDLHLTNKTPAARAEKDWLKVLEGYLDQVVKLCILYEAPFIVAGDLFDKPNAPPEVVNFAMDCLPSRTWAVPGQHDLAFHNYEDIHRTAYWTLVAAKRIGHLQKGERYQWLPDWDVVGWPWGSDDFEPNDAPSKGRLTLAVIHAYCWTKGSSHVGADAGANLKKWHKRLNLWYNAAAFGDNHQGFNVSGLNRLSIINCGTFTRRRTDERLYSPFVGLLTLDGEIRTHHLQTKGDKWSTKEEIEAKVEQDKDFDDVVAELNSLGSDSLDFLHALKAGMAAKNVGHAVRQIIRQAAEKDNG